MSNRKMYKRAYNELVGKWPKICKQARPEATLMCDVASSVNKDGVICEIGRYFGGSLVLMALSTDAKIYSIDCSDEHNRKATKMCNKYCISEGKYEMITDYSENVARNWHKEIDLLLIDGDHTHEGVMSDLVAWIPHVKKSGHILMHDYIQDEGPHSASKQYRRENPHVMRKIKLVKTMALFEKLV